MKLTLRDLFWLTAVIGLSIGWYLDGHRNDGMTYTASMVVLDMKRDLVEVSIGSDDGLVVGSVVQVYSDNTHLGRITITDTDFDQAVGQMDKSLQRSKLRKGDRFKVRYDLERLRIRESRLGFDSGTG